MNVTPVIVVVDQDPKRYQAKRQASETRCEKYSQQFCAFEERRKNAGTCAKIAKYKEESIIPEVSFGTGALIGGGIGMTAGIFAGGAVAGPPGAAAGACGGAAIGAGTGALVGGLVTYIHYRSWLKTDEIKTFAEIVKKTLREDPRFLKYYCAISKELPNDPVINSNRLKCDKDSADTSEKVSKVKYQVYEREKIIDYLTKKGLMDPVTKEALKPADLRDEPYNEFRLNISMLKAIAMDMQNIQGSHPIVVTGLEEAQRELLIKKNKYQMLAFAKLNWLFQEKKISFQEYSIREAALYEILGRFSKKV